MAKSSGLFLAISTTNHNSRKEARGTLLVDKHVPLSMHPSPLVITIKLAAAILGGQLFGGGVLPAQYCPCDFKSLCVAVMICETLVNTQTHTHTQLSTGNTVSSAGLANKNAAMLLPINNVLTQVKHYKHVNVQLWLQDNILQL